MMRNGLSNAARCDLCLCVARLRWARSVAIALPNGTTTALTLKVAVATGPARRFVVGDPTIHYVGRIGWSHRCSYFHSGTSGNTKAMCLLDEATVNVLGETLTVNEWRDDHEMQ